MKFKKIKTNNILYNYFINEKIINQNSNIDDEEVIKRIEVVSRFANACNPGLFNDFRLENILLKYGQTYKNIGFNIVKYPQLNQGYVLHIASMLYEVGGHTRVLSQMIERIKEPQVLIVTQQLKSKMPKWFLEKHSQINILTYENFDAIAETHLNKALILRKLSVDSQKVILYTHAEDTLPILAFSNEDCPVIYYENHQHSWFWLGASVSDIVFSHTQFHEEFTRKHRLVKYSYWFRFTQISENSIKEVSSITKQEAKLRLGIKSDKICVLTVATKAKFYPLTKEYNFFKLLSSILHTFDKIEYIVVGLDDNLKEIKKYSIDTNRAHFVGYKIDLADYYLAADICIDSIPEPSLGATKQAAVIGKACPLFKYGGSGVFNYNENISPLYSKYIGRNKTKKEFLKKLELLVDDADLRIRIASEFRDEYILNSKGKLQERLTNLLDLSNSRKHQVNILTSNKEFYNDDVEETSAVFRNMIEFVSYLKFRDYLRLFYFFIKGRVFFFVVSSIFKINVFNANNFRKLK